MNAHAGKNLNAKTIGNSAETAKVIFNMLAAVDGVIIEPPANPTPPMDNYVNGDKVVVNGYTFADMGGTWINQFGNLAYAPDSYPRIDPYFKSQDQKGDRIPVQGLANGHAKMESGAYDKVFVWGLNFTKMKSKKLSRKYQQQNNPL